MAPYAEDGKHYSARILNIFHQDGTCEVEYIGTSSAKSFDSGPYIFLLSGYEDSNAIVELKLLLRYDVQRINPGTK